jgi:hypothetical protein
VQPAESEVELEAEKPEAIELAAPNVEKPEAIEVSDSEIESEVKQPGAIEVTDTEDSDEESDDDYRDTPYITRRSYRNLP